MVGKAARFLLVVLCILLFGAPAFAMTYTDAMSDMDQNTIKSYYNLKPISQSGIPPAVQAAIFNQYAFTLANGSGTGYAQYRVQGAGSVTVEIFTGLGTFVGYLPWEQSYALGMAQADTAYLQSQQITQALFSPSTGTLYARIGGKLMRAAYGEAYLGFVDAQDAPEDLVDYGLNIYVSTDGENYRKIPLSMESQARVGAMACNWQQMFVKETLVYSLPEGTSYVRVEINDYSFIDQILPNGAMRPVRPSTGMSTVLSSVVFSGENLVLGTPPPESSYSGVPSEYYYEEEKEEKEKEEKSSSKKSSSKASSSKKAAAGTVSSSKAASSKAASPAPKFEGEIIVSQPASKAAASKKSSSKAASPSQAEKEPSAAPEPLPVEELAQAQVFHIAQQEQQNSLSGGIIAYIVVVCALVAVLLLRGRGGQE